MKTYRVEIYDNSSCEANTLCLDINKVAVCWVYTDNTFKLSETLLGLKRIGGGLRYDIA